MVLDRSGTMTWTSSWSPTDGWTLSGSDSVTFQGPTCDRIKAGAYKDVEVLFGCPGVTVPSWIR